MTLQELRELSERSIAAREIMKIQNEDGTPYFHVDFIVKRVLGLSSDDIADNKQYKSNNAPTEFEF